MNKKSPFKTTVVLLIFGILIGFSMSQAIGSDNVNQIFKKKYIQDEVPISKAEIVENCKSLTLKESAYCLRDNVKSFYKYTITDDSITLSFKELKELGGDCRDYSFLYEELAKSLGFGSTTRAYGGLSNIFPGHREAFIWDDNTYCELDLLDVYCKELIRKRGEFE